MNSHMHLLCYKQCILQTIQTTPDNLFSKKKEMPRVGFKRMPLCCTLYGTSALLTELAGQLSRYVIVLILSVTPSTLPIL